MSMDEGALRRLEEELAQARREFEYRAAAIEAALAQLRETTPATGDTTTTTLAATPPEVAPAEQSVAPQPEEPPPPSLPPAAEPRQPTGRRMPSSKPTFPSDRPVRMKTPTVDWQFLAGPRGMAILGGAVLLLGIVFLFVIAVDRGWVSDWLRCAIGVVASFLVLAGSVWARRRFGRADAPAVAAGVAFAGLFATLGAGAVLYDLVPLPLALAGVVLIASSAVGMGIWWESELLASFGVVGALLAAPLATGSLEADAVLFTVVMLTAATTACIRQRWLSLLGAAFAIVVPQVLVCGLVLLLGDREHVAAAWVALPAFATLLLVSGVLLRLARPPDHGGSMGLVLALGSFPAFLFTLAAVTDAGDGHGLRFGVALLAPTAAYVVLALTVLRARDPVLQTAALGSFLGLLAVATAAVLDGASLTLVFAIESALAASVAWRARDGRLLVAGWVYLGLAYAHGLLFDAEPEAFTRWDDDVGGDAWVAFVVAGAALLVGVVGERLDARAALPGRVREFLLVPRGESVGPASTYVRRAFDLLAASTALWGASLYLIVLAHEVRGGSDAARVYDGHVLVTGLVTGVGVILYLAVRNAVWRWYGQALLVAALAKVAGVDLDEYDSWTWSLSLAVVASGAFVAGSAGPAIRRADSRRWLTVDASDLAAAATMTVAVAYALPKLWPDALVPWEWLALAALGFAASAALFVALRNRDMLTVAWVATASLVLISLVEALAPGHWQALALALTTGAAVLLGCAHGLRDPRLALGSAFFGAVAAGITLAEVAPLSDLFARSSSPATGIPAVAALTAVCAAYAVLQPLGLRRDGDELDLALARRARGARRVCAWLTAAGALYAVGLGVLGLAQTLPGDVNTNFQRGHAVVSGIWAIVGLCLLYVGLFRSARHLRLGGLVILGISVAKLFVFDLSQLSSLARAFSFMVVGFVLLVAALVYARLSSDLRRREAGLSVDGQ